MNYIGSKRSLINFIQTSIQDTLHANNDHRSPAELHMMDLFAGTGVVGASFKQAGYHVSANDLQYYSYVMCRHMLETTEIRPKRAEQLLQLLNSAPGEKGFIYNNYSAGGTHGARMYFSDSNAEKCDGIRLALQHMREADLISEDEFYFLLASLLSSVDHVANTASVYGAFLKRLKHAATRPLVLQPVESLPPNGEYHVFNREAVAVAGETSGDILYLDPPYNARQYCSNYHLLETVARYDEPAIIGRTGLRAGNEQKSIFCSVGRVCSEFERLIACARYRYIFLSYNNEGLMPLESIRETMSRYGDYSVKTRAYRRFKADRDENRTHKSGTTTEYLHILIKRPAQ